MSLKDLFKQTKKNIFTSMGRSSVGEFVSGSEAESLKQLESFYRDQARALPEIDYRDPSTFSRFGSAKKYYGKSFSYIADTYPYDGSLYEKTEKVRSKCGCFQILHPNLQQTFNALTEERNKIEKKHQIS